MYDDLITSFFSHWRLYLSARSLGSSWLEQYTSRVGPTYTQPSQKADASPSVHNITLSDLPVDPHLMDPPLHSESDDDSDWELITGEDLDDTVDAEDVLDDND